MLLSLNRRDALMARLIGLVLMSWSVIQSNKPPALHGRGLVVLLLLLVLAVVWLIWTFWTSRSIDGLGERNVYIVDLYVMAFVGALLATACPNGAASVAAFVAAMSAAVRTDLRRAMVVVGTALLGMGGGAIIYHFSAIAVLAYLGGWLAMALAGSNVRQTQVRAEQAELLLAQSQRSHEEQLRATRLEEQTRIAREIHDVLAHALAGLTIQLEATTALIDQGADPQSIRARIERAHELARDGLRETRRAVGALREEASVPVPLAVKALVDAYRAESDAAAEFTLDCEELLQGPLGEAVLRVVQEALTNVRKHAPGASVNVAINADPEAVTVVVEDRPVQPVAVATRNALSASGGGYGLRGMRERATLLGGTLGAGPADLGWRVELRLPLGVQG